MHFKIYLKIDEREIFHFKICSEIDILFRNTSDMLPIIFFLINVADILEDH